MSSAVNQVEASVEKAVRAIHSRTLSKIKQTDILDLDGRWLCNACQKNESGTHFWITKCIVFIS